MKFIPLYYGEKLHPVNLAGDVGVVTLWSGIEQTLRKLKEWGVNLDSDGSRIAVVGNLYGNGLPHLLRNLLWNPQVSYLLVLGQNLYRSKEHLTQFFTSGLECAELLGSSLFRIVGTDRMIDGEVTPEMFGRPPSITALGKLSEPETRDGVGRFFATLPEQRPCILPRKEVALPEVKVERHPSEPRAHTIVRRSPLEAWRELIFRLVRFGYRVQLKKGERVELQSVKVVVTEPEEDSDHQVRAAGFDPESFRRYQDSILRPEKPDDLAYTYGNRLRGYFLHQDTTVDSLEVAVRLLKADPESRHAFVSLWDTNRDTPEAAECPCLVNIFFRRFDGALTMTVAFRTHNAMDAWPENVWGLIAIQRYVATRVGMPRGPIVVTSYSISVSEDSLARAKAVAAQKESDDVVDPLTGKRSPRYDPNGNIMVTIDRSAGDIIVQHSYDGVVLNAYRGKTAEALERLIARDCVISEISHALYVGRELAKAEQLLNTERRG